MVLSRCTPYRVYVPGKVPYVCTCRGPAQSTLEPSQQRRRVPCSQEGSAVVVRSRQCAKNCLKRGNQYSVRSQLQSALNSGTPLPTPLAPLQATVTQPPPWEPCLVLFFSLFIIPCSRVPSLGTPRSTLCSLVRRRYMCITRTCTRHRHPLNFYPLVDNDQENNKSSNSPILL